jgi:hypothetical protein
VNPKIQSHRRTSAVVRIPTQVEHHARSEKCRAT